MDATAYQIITIANGQREVLETLGSLEAALTAQVTRYSHIVTRIMPLDGLDFDTANAAHLQDSL